jgi:hypothetical protein
METKINIDSLPRLLDVKTVKKEFFSGEVNLNLNAVYCLFHRENFPKLIVGKKMFTPTHLFIDWLEKESTKGADQ